MALTAWLASADAAAAPDEGAHVISGTYGYLFAFGSDELQLAAECKEIRHFCRARGYRLAGTFCDRGASPGDLDRPGLTGLLDVLAVPHTEARVVVPDWPHLSELSLVKKALVRLITAHGAELVVMADEERRRGGWGSDG